MFLHLKPPQILCLTHPIILKVCANNSPQNVLMTILVVVTSIGDKSGQSGVQSGINIPLKLLNYKGMYCICKNVNLNKGIEVVIMKKLHSNRDDDPQNYLIPKASTYIEFKIHISMSD